MGKKEDVFVAFGGGERGHEKGVGAVLCAYSWG